jgi:DNA polymerase-3 subunit gamma/tau
VSQALYRKYRSKSLDEVVGQNHITSILKQAIAQEKTSHAYLLTGPRGVGKTSVARILAYEINKLPYSDDGHLDIIEIDAASNNGVDDVRDLREKVALAPVSATKKIYIIDEVHMLSKPAFNALLKTLEEPPEHVVFILATTDIEKLPRTIISRTQQLTFRLIDREEVVKHLRHIANTEKIKISDEALMRIAERGEGSFRDSISLLDQFSSLSNSGEITAEIVESSLGIASHQTVESIISATTKGDLQTLVSLTNDAYRHGISATVLAEQIAHKVKEHAIKQPELLGLLDAIIEISRSPYPELKLLSTLGLYSGNNSSSKEEVTLPKNITLAVGTRTKNDVSITVSAPAKQERAKNNVKKSSTKEIDWEALIEHTRKKHVALHSVLIKCSLRNENDVIALYTINAFYKKKLDDPKYSSLLYKSLDALGMGGINIETIPTPPPPKDSQAAAIVAIMGGGEEVELPGES